MLNRWQGWLAAAVTATAAVLVALDQADGAFRRWWLAAAGDELRTYMSCCSWPRRC